MDPRPASPCYCQLVLGPPGAGKTTYCRGMSQFLSSLQREVAVVNLDPANDSVPEGTAVDLRDLVELSRVMEEFSLGPNGGLVYCMEFLEANIDWLIDQLEPLRSKYLIFDFPGQVELYTHSTTVSSIVQQLAKRDFRFTVVNLVDSVLCRCVASQPSPSG